MTQLLKTYKFLSFGGGGLTLVSSFLDNLNKEDSSNSTENDDIENEEKEQPWWVLSSDEKETIEKANIYFAEKHKSINGNGKEQNVAENNYEEH